LDYIRHLDYSTFEFFNNLIKDSYFAKIVVYLLAKYLILIFFAILGYLFWFYKKGTSEEYKAKRATVYTFLALAWAFLIDQIIGLFFIRNRPLVSHPLDVKQLAVTIDCTSFPSAHTIFVFTIATSIYMAGYKKLGVVLYILSLLVGLARIAAGVHYPSDIIGGLILGIFAAWLVHREGGWVKNNLLKEFEDKK
jgi:undecaprenyl-diphosphatase